MRVAHVPGGEVKRIKKMPRPEARMARALAFYRDRLRSAATVGDVQAAGFDLYRGAVAHAPADMQRLLTDRFTAFVEDAVSTITKGR
jgi:hypothetical protein